LYLKFNVKNMHRILIVLLINVCLILKVESQKLGLLTYNKEKTVEGYSLFYPNNQNTVWLMDNCGSVVHKWVDAPTSRPGNAAYILPNGSLLKTRRPASVTMDTIWAGGGGATIEIVDWDNKPSWSYTLNNGKARLHHDVKILPNGNIIAIVWERWTKEKAIEEGRDPALITQNQLWPDYIIELDPKINSANPIVWEWHAKDHLVQNFDSSKRNFGKVNEHPELIDLNFDTSNGAADWMHSNAIDYNAQLDQILLSVPTFHELWIIDHSTTTAQAASHKGGKSNMGGDLLYRIGNPAAYQRGTVADQTLFYPHDCHWISDLSIGHPDYGKIMVFNNQISTTYSTVEKFAAPWSMYDVNYPKVDSVWGPKNFTETFRHPGPKSFVSSGLSSAQILPNDNILLLSGRQGYCVELTKDNEIVWEYVIPLKAGKPVATTEVLADNDNVTFRIYKYLKDYPAFVGKDLSPKGFIETNPDLTLCDRILAIDTDLVTETKWYPNPVNDKLTIEGNFNSGAIIEVIDVLGRVVDKNKVTSNVTSVDVSLYKQGIYLIFIEGKAVGKFLKE
jgi:hypothetical protein